MGQVALEPVQMLPVHGMIHVLHKHYAKQWANMFIGQKGDLGKFWDTVRGDDPRLHAYQSRLAMKPDYKTKCVPLALHGDGVPVFKGGKSMYIVSATSLMASGSNVDQKLLIASDWSHMLAKSNMDTGKDTVANAWKVVRWDMDALWSGMHPTKYWDGNGWPENSLEATLAGTPLADGYCALQWVLKRELRVLCQCLVPGTLGHQRQALHGLQS